MRTKQTCIIAVATIFLFGLAVFAISAHARTITHMQVDAEAQPSASLDTEPPEPLEFVDQIGGRITALAIQGDYLYAGIGPRLVILDVSNRDNPQRVGQTEPLPGAIERLSIQDNLAFTANGEGGLRIIDVKAPTNPQEIGFYPGTISDVEIDGDVVFLASTVGLISLDVSDPALPRQLDILFISSAASRIALDNDVVTLIAGSQGFWTIDVNNPRNMHKIKYTDTVDGHPADIVAANDFLYVAVIGNPIRQCESGWIFIYDISDPANPQTVGNVGTGEGWDYLLNNGLDLQDNVLYVVSEPGLYIIDVSSPRNPSVTAVYYAPFSMAVASGGNYAYVSNYYRGIETVDLNVPGEPNNISTYATLPTLWSGDSIDFDDEGLYVSDEMGFSIIKLNQHDQFEISSFHRVLDFYDGFASGPLMYRDNTVYFGGGAYYHCVQLPPHSTTLDLVDVSVPEDPSLIGRFIGDPDRSVYALGTSNSHAFIFTRDGPFGGDLIAIDISSLESPKQVDRLYILNTQDGYLQNPIWYGAGPDGLSIVDVTQPEQMNLIGQFESEGDASYVYVHDRYAWLSVSESQAEFQLDIIDVENPSAPRKVGEYQTASLAKVIDIIGNQVFVAEDHTLVVLDISDPLHPYEIASYETIAQATRVQIIDSYLNIYIADGERGLWVFRPEVSTIPRTIDSQQTTNPPTIDGNLSDWHATGGTILDLPTARNVIGIRPSTPDVSASVRSLWTDSMLYFAVEVIDNELVADSAKVWEDDAIEIALDALHDHLPGGVDDHQYTTTLDGRTADFGTTDDSFVAAVQKRIDGWDVEIAIPVGNFGLGSFNEGDIMGLNLAVIDDDTGGDFDSYLLWESDRTWETMPDWGQLHLVNESTIKIPATPTVPTITPTSTPIGDTFTFQEGFLGYSGAEDTSINQWNPVIHYGDSDTLTVRGDGAIGTLLQYDLSALPDDIAIRRATLSLYPQERSNPQALDASVYPLLRSWSEAQATWERASNGDAWQIPGADGAQDREYVAADQKVVDWLQFWASFDITGLVQRWVDGQLANNGVVIKQKGGPAVGFDFPSRDVTGWENEPYRPELIVSYWNATPTSTPTFTPTATPTPTATFTPTPTSTPTVTPTSTPLCLDDFEPDDTWQQAKLIYLDGEPQQRNFHQPDDIDYVKFGVTAGTELTLYTDNLGSGVDTTLTLYDTDGVTQLAYNDIDPLNPPASRIDWTATTSGTYFLKAAHFNPEAGGCSMTYELAVERITPTPTPTLIPLYLPLMVK